MPIKDIAFSTYPITQRITDVIEQQQKITLQKTVVLGELKRHSIPGIFGALRDLRCERLWVVVSDHNYQPLLPLLTILAALTRADTLKVVDFSGTAYPFSRTAALACRPFSLLAASLRGLLAVWQTSQESVRLAELAPQGDSARLPERPRIAYLKTNLWFGVQAGGSVGHIAGVVNGFSRIGCRVETFAVEDLPMLDSAVTTQKITTSGATGLPLESANYQFLQGFIREVGERLSQTSPQLIYQRNCLANYAGVVLSRKFGVPLVIEYNGSEVWVAEKWGTPLKFSRLAQRIERINLEHAHLIVVVSEVLKDELVAKGIPEENVLYYPNCVDPEIYDPRRYPQGARQALRQRLGIAEDAVVCTFVGTFGPWHGVELLAGAVRRMVESEREWIERHKVHFMLVGDGQLMPQVRTILEPAMGQVTLTGLVPQHETPGYLAASDLLLSPHVPNVDGSRFFGSPTKLFEYMAMEKGIVASDLDQIGDILRDSLRSDSLPQTPPGADEERVAVLFPPGDMARFIAGIKFQVENPAWREALGRNARKEALAKYTWDIHVSKILDALVRLGSRNN